MKPGVRRGALRPELERELEQVHRLELARVLRDAVSVRLDATGRGQRLFGGARPAGLRTWRRDAAHVLALAALDRVELAGGAAVARWLGRDPADWPCARTLATESLLLEDCDEGRLVLGLAQIAAEEPLAAVSTLAEARRRGVAGSNRWRVLAALASAGERSGAESLALDALSLALREPACGVGPRCAALVLALLHGREELARRAAGSLRLRRVGPAGSTSIRRELGELLAERREPRPFCPRAPRLRALFAAWTRERSLVGDVCRSLREPGTRDVSP